MEMHLLVEVKRKNKTCISLTLQEDVIQDRNQGRETFTREISLVMEEIRSHTLIVLVKCIGCSVWLGDDW